jgi:hypothetical protein
MDIEYWRAFAKVPFYNVSAFDEQELSFLLDYC